MLHTMYQSMFHLSLPVLEKIARPVIVYLCLIFFLRIFGKRELAQLNPFDLVVLLSLSNTVQNAIIGEDNSVTGGVIGAFSLLAINWLLMRLLFRAPKVTHVLEGSKTTLIQNGVVDQNALKTEALTHDELIMVLNKNGFNHPDEVKLCVLEPSGTFYVEGIEPSKEAQRSVELMEAVHQLSREVRELRAELTAKG